jgi:TonB family protein
MKRTFATVVLLSPLFLHGMRGQDLAEIARVTREIRRAEAVINAHSVEEKAALYCHTQQSIVSSLLGSLDGPGSVEDLELALKQKKQPDMYTQWTQNQLLSAAYVKMNQCRSAILEDTQWAKAAGAARVVYWQGWILPSDDDERKFIAEAQGQLQDLKHPGKPETKVVQPEPPCCPPDQEPYRLFNVEPEYSEQARRAHWQGDIDVSIAIDEKGKVTNVTVLNSPGMGMSAKVIAAVSQWHFKPKIKDRVPVASTVNFRVSFRLP